jgi:hypothetical protein
MPRGDANKNRQQEQVRAVELCKNPERDYGITVRPFMTARDLPRGEPVPHLRPVPLTHEGRGRSEEGDMREPSSTVTGGAAECPDGATSRVGRDGVHGATPARLTTTASVGSHPREKVRHPWVRDHVGTWPRRLLQLEHPLELVGSRPDPPHSAACSRGDRAARTARVIEACQPSGHAVRITQVPGTRRDREMKNPRSYSRRFTRTHGPSRAFTTPYPSRPLRTRPPSRQLTPRHGRPRHL